MRDSSEPNTVNGCVDDAALAQEFVELLGRLNIRHHPMVADLKKANPTPAQVLHVRQMRPNGPALGAIVQAMRNAAAP